MPDIMKIKPGGMLSDIVEDKLGNSQHLEVINLRHNRFGQWEIVKGYKTLWENADYSDIRAAIEITEDRSGDRFILFQNEETIYRLDYDDGDGNGYENETPAAITLPSGVTIASGVTVKFHYFRGVVRIIGPTEPVWYGYINNRTLFPDSIYEVVFDDSDSASDWDVSDATLIYDTTYELNGTNCLEVVQTALDGYGFKEIETVVGEKYRLFLAYMPKTGATGSGQLMLGSSLGGFDYGIAALQTASAKYKSIIIDFTATTTTTYLVVNPGETKSSNGVYLDEMYLIHIFGMTVDGWKCEKAAVQSEIYELTDDFRCDSNLTVDEFNKFRFKTSNVYDLAQNGLLTETTPDVFVFDAAKMSAMLNVPYPPENRLTGIDVFGAVNEPDNSSDPVYGLTESFRLTEEIPVLKISRDVLTTYYDNAYPYRIYLNHSPSTVGDQYYPDWLLLGLTCPYKIIIHQWDGQEELETYVTNKVIGNAATPDSTYIEIADRVDTLDATHTGSAGQSFYEIYRLWEYDAVNDLVKIPITIDNNNLPTTEFESMAGYPESVDDISPNMSSYDILNEVAYCTSLEDEEQDVVRYSPVGQFDIFPNENIIQTKTGDQDQNVMVVRRGDRMMIFKNHSFAQGSVNGAEYYEDTGIAARGLYSDRGFIVIDATVWFVDRDDIIRFSGASPEQFLMKSGIRTFYQEYVGTDSILLFNKIDQELWIILTGKILVYSFEKNEFYVRETDIDILGGFLNYENELIAFSSDKLVKYNHSETTFDESIRFYLKNRIEDNGSPDNYKKVKRIWFVGQCSESVQINCEDDSEAHFKSKVVIPSSVDEKLVKANFGYLYKQLFVEVHSYVSATTLSGMLRELTIEIRKWK